jgi:hypothetical protein
MGNSLTNYVSYEDVQRAQTKYTIISTFPTDEQGLLIYHTVPCTVEITIVEESIKKKTPIIIYGRHIHDPTIYKKYEQIKKLGGIAYIYPGGLYEWLLLQEIYGNDEFKTTTYKKPMDLLKYKPNNVLNIL